MCCKRDYSKQGIKYLDKLLYQNIYTVYKASTVTYELGRKYLYEET